MIHLLRQKATPQQVADMLEELGSYIKLAVDIERGLAAGGGELHADCEEVLLDNGSQQAHVWGADWYPASQAIKFEALINLRPSQNNRSMYLQAPDSRNKVEAVVRTLLEGVV